MAYGFLDALHLWTGLHSWCTYDQTLSWGRYDALLNSHVDQR